MAKRIHLTEGQLRNLIEYEIKNVANGLDPRTLLNLARKRRQQSDAEYDKDMEGYKDNMGTVQLIDRPDTNVPDDVRNNRQSYLDKANAISKRAKENRNKRQNRIDDIESYAMQKYTYLHPESQYAPDGRGGFAAVEPDVNLSLYFRNPKEGEGWLDDKGRPTSSTPVGAEDLDDFLNHKSYYDSKFGWGKPEDKAKAFWKKNEAVVHKVTENVMRKLKESITPIEGKRRAHLTESQLYSLVEQTINELDWKTYMNAATKRIAQGNDAYDEPGVDYQAAKEKGNALYDKGMGLAKHAEKALKDKHNINSEEDNWVLFPKGIGVTEKHPMTAGKHSRRAPYNKSSLLVNGEEVKDNSDFEHYNSNDSDMKDVANYQKGNSKYTKGEGWNEAIVRSVTENVLRRINESEEQEEPYLWIEIAYYDDDESVEGLDSAETDDEISYYDYNYGAFPEDGFEHATTGTPGSSDSYYMIHIYPYGGAELRRKAYLSEIIKVLKQEGRLSRASDDAKAFVKKYCPQFLD